MILSGILHSSLGGVTVIRGVAPLGELARCSRRDDTYQRNLIETHKAEIEQFLSDKRSLFFPEVILSATLQFDFKKDTGRNIRQEIEDGKGFSSNKNGLKIRTVKTKAPKGMDVPGGPKAPTAVWLEIPEAELEGEGLGRLFRIDGNHRLSAAHDLKQGHANYSLETPFCIILLNDDPDERRFEKVVFHNINAKQIPLTSEHNLKLILEDGKDALFTDADLLGNPSLGASYLMARRLLPEFEVRFLSGLTKHFENKHTLALGLSQFLRDRDAALGAAKTAEEIEAKIDTVREALKRANRMYEGDHHKQLREAGCHGVLTAAVHFAYKNDGAQLPAFARWVTSNRIDRLTPSGTTRGLGYHYHLGQTQAVDAASLVEVFESILKARSREVFVSMEFGTHTDAVYKAIEKAITRLNEKHKLKQLGLALKPIRIDRVIKGHSYTINDEILNVIDGSGLLIADLTQGNKNVYHEVGYMMGLNKGRGGSQDNFILIADQAKLAGDSAIGFNLRAWQQLRFSDTSSLEDDLIGAMEEFYKLKAEE